MSFRTALLATINRLRYLSGPTGFDVRTTTVTITTRSWTGGEDGPEVRVGSYTDSTITLTPVPKVQNEGDTGAVVGPITPSHSTGGYTVAQLNPDLSAEADRGKEVFWTLTGPNGARKYQLVELESRKPFRYMAHLKAVTDSGRRVPI